MVKIEGFRVFRKSLPSFILSALESTLPHLSSGQKAGKWRIKYVIHSPRVCMEHKKSGAEAPQCSLENEFFVGLLHLRYHMPKNLSAISVERLSTRLTLARL